MIYFVEIKIFFCCGNVNFGVLFNVCYNLFFGSENYWNFNLK